MDPAHGEYDGSVTKAFCVNKPFCPIHDPDPVAPMALPEYIPFTDPGVPKYKHGSCSSATC